MKISKIWPVLIGIFVVLAAGLPALNGVLLERFLNHWGLENRTDAVEILSIDRGLFSSAIEWKLTCPFPFAGAKDIRVTDRARHGCFAVTSTSSLEKNPWFEKFCTRFPDGKPPFEITTQYKISGTVTAHIALEECTFTSQGQTVELQAGTVHLAMDRHQQISFLANWGGGHIPEKFESGPLNVDSRLKKIQERIWDGRLAVRADHIRSLDRLQPFEASRAALTIDSGFDPETSRLCLGLGASFEVLNQGDGPVLRDGNGRLELNRVNAYGWQWATGLFSDIGQGAVDGLIQGRPVTDSLNQAVQAVSGRAGFQFFSQCDRLLKQGLEIRAKDVTVQIDEDTPGQVTADMALALKKNMTLAGFIPIVLRPGSLFEILDVKTSIGLPLAMARKAPDLLRPVVPGMGAALFVRKKDRLSHTAETRQGRLFLNDQEVMFEPHSLFSF